MAACTTDPAEIATNPAAAQAVVVRAAVDEDTSRATMSDGGLKLSFSVADADEIGLYLTTAALDWTEQNLCFRADSESDGWVDFALQSPLTGNLTLQAGQEVYAYYPYTATQSSITGSTESGSDSSADTRTAPSANWPGTRNFDIPETQTQSAAGDFSHIADYYVMAALPTVITVDADNNASASLRFGGIFTTLRFRLVNDTDTAVTISQIDFEVGEGEALTGLYTADLTDDPTFANTGYATTAVDGRTSNRVSVVLTEPAEIPAGEEIFAYAVVHPMTVSYCVLTAWTTDGCKFVERKAYNVHDQVVLTRQRRETFRCTMSDDNKYAAAAPEQDAEGYYLIDSREDLLWVSEHAADATMKYRMTQSIDLSGGVHTPIGYGTNYGGAAEEFAGEFDGGGYTISNVTVNPAYNMCIGLFGATKQGAVIKNLKVENLTYTGSASATEQKWIGGLVGYARPGTTVSDVSLKNIVLTAESSSYRLGGAIGCMELGSTAQSSYSNISVEGATLTGGYGLGGFAGTEQQNAVLHNCTVKDITIRHINQYRWPEAYYPATKGYAYCSSYYFGDVNSSFTTELTFDDGVEPISGTNSRTDLDDLGCIELTTWDIQPYIGELSANATVTLNGVKLTRTVEVDSEEAFVSTVMARGGEIVVAADLDFSSLTGMYVPVEYPTVITLRQGSSVNVGSNYLKNNSSLTIQGAGTLTGTDLVLVNGANGKLQIDGGTFVTTSFLQRGSAILNEAGGEAVINGGSVEAAYFALRNQGRMTLNGGSFSSTSNNGDMDDQGTQYFAYAVRTEGSGSCLTINDGVEIIGIQGALAAITESQLIINGGVFSTYYTASGAFRNFYALYVASDATATVYDGKFYSEGSRACVYVGNDDIANNPLGVACLQGGYYEDMGGCQFTSTTIAPVEGYRFIELEEPLVETASNGKQNTYYYRIVAE